VEIRAKLQHKLDQTLKEEKNKSNQLPHSKHSKAKEHLLVPHQQVAAALLAALPA